jgi:hypothetical protein
MESVDVSRELIISKVRDLGPVLALGILFEIVQQLDPFREFFLHYGAAATDLGTGVVPIIIVREWVISFYKFHIVSDYGRLVCVDQASELPFFSHLLLRDRF